MTLYQWLSVLGIPSLRVSFLAFLRVQRNQNKALKLGLQGDPSGSYASEL